MRPHIAFDCLAGFCPNTRLAYDARGSWPTGIAAMSDYNGVDNLDLLESLVLELEDATQFLVKARADYLGEPNPFKVVRALLKGSPQPAALYPDELGHALLRWHPGYQVVPVPASSVFVDGLRHGVLTIRLARDVRMAQTRHRLLAGVA